MTWAELRDAITRWGVKDDEVVLGVRLDPGHVQVGIRRRVGGIEIVGLGRLVTPAPRVPSAIVELPRLSRPPSPAQQAEPDREIDL
jgi:hypothetical protein